MKPEDIKRCREAVARGNQLRIRTFAMLDATEAALKEILDLILTHYRRPELVHAIYTAIKELTVNAVKANMKRVVFHRRGLDVNRPGDSEQGSLYFKERLQKGSLETFALEARELGYVVIVDFFFEPDVLLIEIRNNTLLANEENERLRNKLARSMTYEDIAQFYMDHADPTEGEGLGMTMITVMLRQVDIDPHCFTIFTEGNETVARLELPMHAEYVPTRQRFEKLGAGLGEDRF